MGYRKGVGGNDVGTETYQLVSMRTNTIRVVGGIAKVEPHIATLDPAQFREPLQQGAL